VTPVARRHLSTVLRGVTPLAVLAGVSALLLRFPPGQFGFYPQCPIHQYLHIDCPGCGSTRALSAILQGHLIEAFRFNALFTLALPFAALWAAGLYIRSLKRRPFAWPHPRPATLYAALAITVIFTVMRNL
jgi:uncharacterized protein DUF2752